MLVRDGTGGASPLEVLMVRRNLNSDFVGGAYVFPGGAVDPADGGPDAEARCAGRTDAEASVLLGVPAGGLAYWVAAVRESFEEVGILLAYPTPVREAPAWRERTGAPGQLEGSDRPMLSLADPGEEERFVHHRRALNAGAVGFLELCREERLQLAVDRVHYFAHWITPIGAPRRYDTRFFVAPAPADQTPAHDAGETIAEVWITPAEALRRHRAREIELILPTIRSLQAITRFGTSGELLAAAARAGQVPAMEPRVLVDGRGVRILLPGDEGFDTVAADGPVPDPGTLSEAIRVASEQANRPS
jgi:8-oxo-dGTP pyrophosphatase MutT (NUDIX family)